MILPTSVLLEADATEPGAVPGRAAPAARHATPAEAVRTIVERIAARSGTSWVAVDGWGAAGKTSLAARIAEALPGAVVVHVDEFARPQLAGWEIRRFCSQLRDPLLAGRPASFQRWDYDADTGGEWVTVLPGGPVVVEGVSCTDVRVGLCWDVAVWVDAPLDVRRSRAVERDGEARRARWLTDWIPNEEAYVRAQHPLRRVDLVVDGTG